MIIALAQLNYHVGDFKGNTSRIIEEIKKAKDLRADIVVFSELCVCGYPANDLLSFNSFIETCQKSVAQIAKHAQGIAVVIGAPEPNPDIKGKPLFNAAYFLSGGKIYAKAFKSLLPDYDVFDEYRFFEPATAFNIIQFKGKRIALTICEDLWNIGNEGLYHYCPMDVLANQNAELIINIAASPFDYTQPEKRLSVLKANVLKYKIPLVYVNQVGANTSLVFDGGSMVLNNNADIIEKCSLFNEDFKVIDLDSKTIISTYHETEKYALIYEALVLGIRDYFKKSGLKKAVLGLSGGIDSALTLALAVEALGAENVMSLLLPSPYSSEHSINDAILLAENLSTPYKVISISEIFNSTLHTMDSIFEGKPQDLTEENMQARIRALLLMGYANKFNCVLLNTSNKSEAAVGYGTLYGDMCGAISVLGDVYKTEVYKLSAYVNRHREIIPVNTITKPPSAELRPNQKDVDSLPDYEILDQILFEYIENALSANQIVNKGFDKSIVEKVVKLVNNNEFKRYQTPPVIRVSPKAFGSGRQIPLVAKFHF